MSEDLRCCGSGTCMINAAGACWCGQRWNGNSMCSPNPPKDLIDAKDALDAEDLTDPLKPSKSSPLRVQPGTGTPPPSTEAA